MGAVMAIGGGIAEDKAEDRIINLVGAIGNSSQLGFSPSGIGLTYSFLFYCEKVVCVRNPGAGVPGARDCARDKGVSIRV